MPTEPDRVVKEVVGLMGLEPGSWPAETALATPPAESAKIWLCAPGSAPVGSVRKLAPMWCPPPPPASAAGLLPALTKDPEDEESDKPTAPSAGPSVAAPLRDMVTLRYWERVRRGSFPPPPAAPPPPLRLLVVVPLMDLEAALWPAGESRPKLT